MRKGRRGCERREGEDVREAEERMRGRGREGEDVRKGRM